MGHGHMLYRRQQVKWPFDIENFILKQNSQLSLTVLDSIYFALTTENIKLRNSKGVIVKVELAVL